LLSLLKLTRGRSDAKDLTSGWGRHESELAPTHLTGGRVKAKRQNGNK